MTALDDLTTLLPPPPGAATTFDWTTVEQRLSVPALPDDFKRLLAAYGDVRFCNALRLFRPATEPWLDLAEVTLAAREPLGDNEFGNPPTDVPPGVSTDPSTLIQWGGSFGGDYCLWDAHDPDPSRWTLIFTDIDKFDWGYYPGTVTEYLRDWLTRRTAPIPLWNLDTVLPDGRHPFAETYDPTDPAAPVTARIDSVAS
ncbi:hypothetical protein [Nocardia blacklockiae]|uniref:hypothetical protein n=1 Tax=Nocardia blacklockiae TaxID=480036 RepID=UPI001893E3C9|nr:hypothetical protein [Nocardia blacklockiae]MBF6175686.1 hypothetical protein [Nocardia blacklockiae]